MSRYGFNVDDVEVVVGWDNPCQTFFGDVEDEHGNPIVSTMLDMGKTDVYTVLDLESLLSYRIPDDIALKLCEDMAKRTEPTPLQKAMGQFIKPMLEDK